MKKFFLFPLALFIGLCFETKAVAQINPLFSDDFSKYQENPTIKWDTASDPGHFYIYISNSETAKGKAPEILWGYDPSQGIKDVLNGTYRIVTKPLSTKGYDKSYVSMKFAYMANQASTGDKKSFGIAARIKGGDWLICTQYNNPGELVGPDRIVVELPQALANQDNVQVAPFIKTVNDGMLFLFFMDDVEVFAVDNGEYKAEITLNSSTFCSGALKMDLVVTNQANAFSQFEMSYQLDGKNVQTENKEIGYKMNPTQTYAISEFMPKEWDATAYGLHSIKMWVSKIDGTAVSPENIVYLEKTITNVDPSKTYKKRPMVEEFTSSTCAPCASFNSRLFNDLFSEKEEVITYLKYQMNFPSSGDPYYTEEGGARRVYYGVDAVPSLVIDGRQMPLEDDMVVLRKKIEDRWEKISKTPAFFQITYDTAGIDSDQKVHITYTVNTLGILENARVQTAIMEKETYKNATSNGETFFRHVMHKMTPGIGLDKQTGRKVNWKNDTNYTYTALVDMGETNMEDFNDLVVVSFIQSAEGEILQSATTPIVRYGQGAAAEVAPLYVPTYVCQEAVPVGLSIVNRGEDITSLSLSGKIGNSGEVKRKTIEEKLAWGKSLETVFSGLTADKDGVYEASFWVDAINGVPVKDPQTIVKNIIVKKTDIPFLPFVEEFVSSKSKETKVLNDEVNPYYEANKAQIKLAKYPVENDPYARADNANYQKLFSSDVPAMLVNGSPISVNADGSLPSSYFENLVEACKGSKSIFSIKDSALEMGSKSNNTITGELKFKSDVKGSYLLYVVLVESKTTGNKGSNGETSFINTVQGLIPGAKGSQFSIAATGEYTYRLQKTISRPFFVEDQKNLSAFVFVKDEKNTEVLQVVQVPIMNKVDNEQISYNTLSIYPNPASEEAHIKGLSRATVELYNMSGVRVFRATEVSGEYTLDLRSYKSGQYVVKVSEGGKASTAKLTIVR